MSDWPPRFAHRPVVVQAIPLACHGLALIVALRQYKDRPQFRFTGHRGDLEKFRGMPEAERQSYDIFWGAVPWGVQRHLPQRTAFLTMLRDPVERIIAHYHFVISSPSHYLYRRVTSAGWSLHDYVANRTSVELDNDQVRFLSTVPRHQVHFGQVTRAMLDEAKQALEHPDTVFGLAEYFDETLLIFGRAMGWGDVRYVEGGMRSQKPQAPSVPAETLDLIRQTNALDVELYEHARGIFEQRLADLGQSFQEEVARYREQNAALAGDPNWSNQQGELAASPEGPAQHVTAAGAGSGQARARDIYWLASYPRSGNTWLRFLLDSYFFPPARYMQEVGRLSGELDWWLNEATRLGHDVSWILGAVRRAQAKYARPEGFPGELFFKTHFALDAGHPFVERSRGAVCLVRNPRDVLLSGMNFSELTGDAEEGAEAQRRYAQAFIEHRGDPSWVRTGYGTWAGHARSWQAADFPVLLVRYEELKSEPEAQLTRILEFLGAPVDRHRVAQAVEHCSLSRLRNLEVASRAMTSITALRNEGRYFFNKGLSGQSLAPFGPDVEEAFGHAFAEDARSLGYE